MPPHCEGAMGIYPGLSRFDAFSVSFCKRLAPFKKQIAHGNDSFNRNRCIHRCFLILLHPIQPLPTQHHPGLFTHFGSKPFWVILTNILLGPVPDLGARKFFNLTGRFYLE
jgi:hypothetical protein